jgi:hypothetical protein
VLTAASDDLAAKQTAPVPARALYQAQGTSTPAKSEPSRRKSAYKSVLSRGAASAVITRPIPEAVQSLMRMRSFSSDGSPQSRALHSSPSLAEILCDGESRAAWAGECALAAAKNPSTADAAVAVSALAGA